MRYCQGMNYVVKDLLDCCSNDEAATFAILVSLTHFYGFRDMFGEGLARLKLCFFQLDELLKVHLPLTHNHLKTERVSHSMYASSWFLTLYTTHETLSDDHVHRVLELFLVEGWKVVFGVALSVLSCLQGRILSADFEEILGILQYSLPLVKNAYPTPEKLVSTALAFEVENEDLESLERQYRGNNGADAVFE